MATLGIEMCDAGFHAASCDKNDSQCLPIADANGVADWPGFAYFDGQRYSYGRAAENEWFVHPRRVTHTFWSRLAHEPSTIGPAGKPASFSELGFHFFREFTDRVTAATSAPEKVVLAVPSGYLKDLATEEEKIGLVLGMVGELKLPLAGIVDMAAATLCDPRSSGFNPALPIVVVDLQLEGADLTLFTTGEQLQRKDFIHLPLSGYAQLLKHLTNTMGNRFLRHTAFDILADGRIEQTFYQQTKDFLLSDAAEYRFQISTTTRTYEMLAKREQFANDAQGFINTLVQGLQTFLHNSPHAAMPCTLALSERTGHLPGLEARLRAAGFGRLLRFSSGAAACGAARIGEAQLEVQSELGDVPVLTTLPMSLARRAAATPWDARLQKIRLPGPRPAPTHVILDGIGHAIGSANRFTIGVAGVGADLPLPESFNHADDCAVPLVREGGRLWFIGAGRTPVEAGDRLMIRCGPAAADVLFAHCETSNGARGHA